MNPIDGISDRSINNNVNNNVQKWTIKKELWKSVEEEESSASEASND